MAIKYSFVDGVVYGTEDINDIARNIVGAGVMPFLSKGSYKVSDLNAMTSALTEAGTSLDGCKCTAQNAGTEEMYVSVGQGIVFFESGVSLTVDENGYSVEVLPNMHGYIFAHNRPSLQKADIEFAAELPTTGEIVILAEVLADGSLKDKREFARSRVATLGTNATKVISQDRITVYDKYSSAPYYSGKEKILAEIGLSGIDITKFNFLIYQYPYTGTGSTAPSVCEKYFDLKNSTRASCYVKGSLYYHSALFDIILEASRMIIVVNSETVFSSYKDIFQKAIPYLRLV